MNSNIEVKDIMTREVPVVSEEDPVARIRNIFLNKNISSILVYEDEPKGIITKGDISRAFVEERRGIDEVRVREIMTRSLVKTEMEEEPEKAAKKIIEHNISSLPVIEDKEVKGILTKNDLTRYYANHFRGKNQVKDLMTEDVETVQENQSIFHVAKEMNEKNISRLVVIRSKEPIGIITEKDITLATQGLHPSSISYQSTDEEGQTHKRKTMYPMIASDIMQENLKTTEKKEDSSKAGEKMLEQEIGSLVVIENKRLEGIITKTDFVKHLAQKDKD